MNLVSNLNSSGKYDFCATAPVAGRLFLFLVSTKSMHVSELTEARDVT